MLDSIQIDTLPLLERLTMVAPLGLRFWDEVSGNAIGDGLRVTAYPPANPFHRVSAFTNPSGIYVLRSLLGLREVENGTGDAAYWATPPPTRRYVIEVIDGDGRFLPFLFTVDAPVRDIFVWQDPLDGSPPGVPEGVPLYSSPSRAVPAAMAVLRASLQEPDPPHAPAAWALITAHIPGRPPARGIADDRGRVTLIFPYPEPAIGGLGSPPDSAPPASSTPLREQEWTVTLEAVYGRLRPVPSMPDAPAIPDLRDILLQPPATLWADTQRTEQLGTVALKFGQELVVRSSDRTQTPVEPLPVLLITPAASPP